jgi:hypothetical protein
MGGALVKPAIVGLLGAVGTAGQGDGPLQAMTRMLVNKLASRMKAETVIWLLVTIP